MPYCLSTITRNWLPVYLCYSSNLPALLHAYNTAIRAVCHSDFLFATGSPLIVPFSHSAILPLGANRAATTPLSQSANPLLPIYQTPYCQYIILPFCHSYILTFYCFQVSAVSAVLLLLLFIFFFVAHRNNPENHFYYFSHSDSPIKIAYAELRCFMCYSSLIVVLPKEKSFNSSHTV